MSKDRRRRNGLSSWCKNCRSDSARQWVSKNTGRIRKHKPVDKEILRNQTLQYRYGITKDDYDSMLASQDYKCAICHKDSNSMTYHLFVDHCHATNKVRGLLCSPCNAYLGYTQDSVSILNRAVEYINKGLSYKKIL